MNLLIITDEFSRTLLIYANVIDKLHLTFDFIFWSTADFDCCMFTKNCQIYAEQNRL